MKFTDVAEKFTGVDFERLAKIYTGRVSVFWAGVLGGWLRKAEISLPAYKVLQSLTMKYFVWIANALFIS